MRKTIIDQATGNVVNVIVLDEGAQWSPDDGHVIGQDGGWIGARWNGSVYEWITPPTLEE